jgi:hypothetical protein
MFCISSTGVVGGCVKVQFFGSAASAAVLAASISDAHKTARASLVENISSDLADFTPPINPSRKLSFLAYN